MYLIIYFPGAALVSSIYVSPDRHMNTDLITNKQVCDVTGGIELKLRSSTDIVIDSKGKTSVFVCKIGSEGAKQACCDGELKSGVGTVIHLKN